MFEDNEPRKEEIVYAWIGGLVGAWAIIGICVARAFGWIPS